MNQRWRGAGMIGALLVAWIGSSAFYILPEGRDALVLRFGAPVGVHRSAGLKFKLPLVDTVQVYDARLQLLAAPAEEVILGDQKRLEVETYTRYRIADPLRFFQTVRSDDQAQLQLGQLVSTSLRGELGTVNIQSLLSNDRRAVVARIARKVETGAASLGVKVEEVRLHRADLPLADSQAIYARMRSDRQQEAKELRGEGAEWAQKIEAEADRKRTEILSAAERQSDVIRGQGDAKANTILGKAFGKDPKFYHFYRSMQTYGHALAKSGATLVLTPDSAVLRDLKHGPDQRGR